MFNKYLFALLLFPSVTGAQFSFTVKGSGKSLADGDLIYLSYKQDSTWVLDSTIVKNGSFLLSGTAGHIVRGYICRNDNPAVANFLHDAHDIYVEAGEIIVDAKESLSSAVVSGTPLNNDLQQLMLALEPVTRKYKGIKDPDEFTSDELKDTALVRQTKEKILAQFEEKMPVQVDFINRFPHSYVSLVTLHYLSRNSKWLTQVEESFYKLDPGLRGRKEGQEIERRILLGKKIQPGMMAKDFVQPDVQGRPVKLSSFRGQYLLLDFWASWCLPCLEENKNVLKVYNRFRKKGFTVLSVSIDERRDKQKWLDIIKRQQLNWHHVSDLKGNKNEAGLLYGITTIPANVLIDPDGKIIAKDLKGKALDEKLQGLLGN